MKTHTCDVCGKEINAENPAAPQSLTQLDASIGGKDFVLEIRPATWPAVDACFYCFAASMGGAKLATLKARLAQLGATPEAATPTKP